MSDQERITREELMKFLSSLSKIQSEDAEAMADVFCRYDREIQDQFMHNLRMDLKSSSEK
jgi:hypothetical protein